MTHAFQPRLGPIYVLAYAGVVRFYSPDRDEVYQEAIDLRLTDRAFRFLGEMPEHMAINL